MLPFINPASAFKKISARIRKHLQLLLVCFLVFGFFIDLKAQSSNVSPGIKMFTPQTPNAVSLGKYGEVPVSLYNGIPEISIPLYTVHARGVDLPISLNYHSGGIKVEELASWVGLGWTLNAGGVITRSVRGIPDDFPQGHFTRKNLITSKAQQYLNPPLSFASSFELGFANGLPDEQGSSAWILESEGMATDSEPDIFYFNFGGYSGKFFMAEDGNFISAPLQDLKIEVVTTTIGLGVSKWKITTPNGVEYIFATASDGRIAIDKIYNETFSLPIITGWYLVEVVTPYDDIINLYYENEDYTYWVKENETINVLLESHEGFPPDPSLGPNVKKFSQKHPFGVRLKRILSTTSDLNFIPGSRSDLTGSSSLEMIEIKNSAGTLNKSVNFSYGYFQSNGGTGSYYQRLRLDHIEELAGAAPDQVSGGKHRFEYNAIALPSWDPYSQSINSQDLWGYYNGQQNKVLSQSFKAEVPGGIYEMHGARRNASGFYAQAGILQKIIYPTGGFTEFQFEGNTAYASDEDFGLLNVQTEDKGQFLVLNSGDGTRYQDFSIVNPDPLTGNVVMQVMTRQQVPDCPSNPNGFPTCCEMYLEGINGTAYPKTLLKEGLQTLRLTPGTYRMSGTVVAFMENQYTKYPKTYYYNLNWQEYPPESQWGVKSNKVVGGVRIRRIINNNSTGNISIKKYEYNNFGTGISSGTLVNFPQSYATIFRVLHHPGDEYAAAYVKTGVYLQVRSYPLTPLQPTKSSPIGYSNVTEYSGEYGENGKTEFLFTTSNDYPDIIKNYRPFAQPVTYDWRRGLLTSQTFYSFDKNSLSFKKIKSIDNTYKFDKNTRYAYGYAFERETFIHSESEPDILLEDASNFYVAGYKIIGEFFYRDQEIVRTYDPPGSLNFAETITDYNYGWQNGHYQLTSTTEKNSDNSTLIIENKYPADLTLTGDDEAARQSLLSKFMKSAVLEQHQTRNSATVTKTKNKYKVVNSMPLLSSVEFQVGQNPIEQRVLIDDYDSDGNILHQKKVSDVDHSYIWGYNNMYPIAQVVNAMKPNIAFTSFESDDVGGWTISPTPSPTSGTARTGRNFLNLQSGTSITKNGLSSTSTYFVSYWSKNSSYYVNGSPAVVGTSVDGWTYYEHKIMNPSGGTITITGSGNLDELRLYPQGGQMTTYTYDPAVGVTTVTDANNLTTYYEYDALGRLELVRDSNGKILKNIAYHFKGE